MSYLDGYTADGVHIHIEDDPHAVKRNSDPRILFDGEEVEVTHISRYRDGGTTVIETDRGRLVAHRAMGKEPWDEFESERLLDGVPCPRCEGSGTVPPRRPGQGMG